jgi:hypothetical protein
MREAEYLFLSYHPPGQSPLNVAVLVFDSKTDALFWRFIDDWSLIADPFDIEVIAGLSQELAMHVRQSGAGNLLRYFEDTLSNTLQISSRTAITVDDIPAAVDMLYSKFIDYK